MNKFVNTAIALAFLAVILAPTGAALAVDSDAVAVPAPDRGVCTTRNYSTYQTESCPVKMQKDYICIGYSYTHYESSGNTYESCTYEIDYAAFASAVAADSDSAFRAPELVGVGAPDRGVCTTRNYPTYSYENCIVKMQKDYICINYSYTAHSNGDTYESCAYEIDYAAFAGAVAANAAIVLPDFVDVVAPSPDRGVCTTRSGPGYESESCPVKMQKDYICIGYSYTHYESSGNTYESCSYEIDYKAFASKVA